MSTSTCPNWDRNSWAVWPAYLRACATAVCAELRLDRSSTVLDIGCGRARLTAVIADELAVETPIEGVDISPTIAEAAPNPRLVLHQIDAVRYLATQADAKYDGILLKQVIHCLPPDARIELLRAMRRTLKSSGRAAILIMPPTPSIPLFPEAGAAFLSEQLDYRDLAALARTLDFEVELDTFSYPITMPRAQYEALLRERFVSNLRNLTDREIEAGIAWLRRQNAGETIAFDDALHIVVLKRNQAASG